MTTQHFDSLEYYFTFCYSSSNTNINDKNSQLNRHSRQSKYFKRNKMKSLIFQNTHQQLSFTFLFAVIQCMSIIKTTQGCKIHGTDSGVCTNRYLPSTYYNDGNSNEGFNTWEEALENSKTQWALGTDGPCLNGEADFCMPFCVRTKNTYLKSSYKASI